MKRFPIVGFVKILLALLSALTIAPSVALGISTDDSEPSSELSANSLAFSEVQLSPEASSNATLTITYPYADENNDGNNDFVVEAGMLEKRFVFSYSNPKSTSDPLDGSVTAEYALGTTDGDYFYRVSNAYDDDAVSFSGFIKHRYSADNPKDLDVTVSRADMHMDGDSFDKDTVVRDFSLNACDTGDLFLNTPASGCVEMNVGDSFSLYPLRNWMPAWGPMSDRMILPAYHVRIVDLDGSNVVEALEQEGNGAGRHKWVLNAKNNGVALAYVTYDALSVAANQNSDGTYSMLGHTDPQSPRSDYSAIWPENTGVFVISVGQPSDVNADFNLNAARNSGIETTTPAKIEGDALDAELDVLYYAGEKGATCSFTVDPDASVSVARGTVVDGVLQIGEFTNQGVAISANGTARVTGLKAGKHIIRIEKNGNVFFQVVRSRAVHYEIYAGNSVGDPGNLICNSDTGIVYAFTDGIEPITAASYAKLPDSSRSSYHPLVQPGGMVTVSYKTLFHPAGKLLGRYNMTAAISLVGKDGSLYEPSIKPYNEPGQYEFSSNDDCQTLTLTLPDTLEAGAYTIDGSLLAKGHGYGGFGSHREVTYENGITNNGTSAPLYAAYFGALPQMVLFVNGGTSSDELSSPIRDGAVRITIINNTFPISSGSPWDGMLLCEQVDLRPGQRLDEAIDEALELAGYEATEGTYSTEYDSYYISTINGLSDFKGGDSSGWRCMLNGSFIQHQSMSKFSEGNGLRPGDDICVVYTCDNGYDVGSDPFNNSKKLQSLTAKGGSLSPAFSADKTTYQLTVSNSAKSVSINPVPENRNWQVRIYKGSLQASLPGYRPGEAIPVSNGSILTIAIGDPSWPSLNDNTTAAEVYRITVYDPIAQKAIDKKAADAVTSLIKKLPAATAATDANKAAATKARSAYNKLTAAQKKLVPATQVKKLAAVETAVKTTITVNTAKVTKSSLSTACKKAGKKASSIKKIVLGLKVKTLGAKAFSAMKNAKSLVAKTKKLTKKTVKNCLAKSRIATVQISIGSASVNKTYLAKYKKVFTKAIVGKKVTLKR